MSEYQLFFVGAFMAGCLFLLYRIEENIKSYGQRKVELLMDIYKMLDYQLAVLNIIKIRTDRVTE